MIDFIKSRFFLVSAFIINFFIYILVFYLSDINYSLALYVLFLQCIVFAFFIFIDFIFYNRKLNNIRNMKEDVTVYSSINKTNIDDEYFLIINK